MKWILETDRIVPDFRDPYLENMLFECEVLCHRVMNPEGTRAQYFADIKDISGILPIIIGICRSLRLATPLETIETEAEICVH